jgi:hypothetical protein
MCSLHTRQIPLPPPRLTFTPFPIVPTIPSPIVTLQYPTTMLIATNAQMSPLNYIVLLSIHLSHLPFSLQHAYSYRHSVCSHHITNPSSKHSITDTHSTKVTTMPKHKHNTRTSQLPLIPPLSPPRRQARSPPEIDYPYFPGLEFGDKLVIPDLDLGEVRLFSLLLSCRDGGG